LRAQAQDEAHPEGSYFIEWWDQGKRRREAAGANAQDAADKARVREAELTAARFGVIPPAPGDRGPAAADHPPRRADWPSFIETVRPIYEDAELTNLFKACRFPRGCPRQVLSDVRVPRCRRRFATWRDVEFKHTAVRVTAKPLWGFHPKNWEEGEVPVPQKLIELLARFRPPTANADDPLFPSTTGRPDGAILEKLKAVAYRANLNCGHCSLTHKLEDGTVRINRCTGGPFCSRWFLHKFRHTYATRHLQDGIDIRTLQQWMGHRDLASTMYLKGARNRDVQARINAGSLASFA
jgi:integrase/recombinase XerD